MDYQPKLLKCGFHTLLGSLFVVAILALPGRVGAAPVESLVALPGIFNAGSVGIYNSIFGSDGQSFKDHVTFTVFANPPSFDLFTLSTSGAAPYGVAFTGYDLYTGATLISAGPGSSMPITSALGAGSYDMHLYGTILATPTDQHFYSLSLDIAPIPEPETYAMMLAGLGLMGFVARRRKQKTTA